MKKVALTLCAALVAVSALSAQQTPPTTPPAAPAAPAKTEGATVAGNWVISMDYGQGPTEIAAIFKLEGKKLTGSLTSPAGETPLEGEFAEGKLTFGIDVQGMALSFTATLKDADNMTGTMGGQMGDIPWVAKRVKG